MGMRISASLGLVMGALAAFAPARADVFTAMPTADRVVALTFDACEGYEPASFDRPLLNYLLSKNIPFTVFVTGKFARDTADDVAALSALDRVEIGNHSWDHPNTMNHYTPKRVEEQVLKGQDEIAAVTGLEPQFFRFPAGNYNRAGLKAVEALGYHVVHWRWASGDPDRSETAEKLYDRTMRQVAPGDVLIFHINGRGVHTAEAMPAIVEGLEKAGYRFVLVSDYVGRKREPRVVRGLDVSLRSTLERIISNAPLSGVARMMR
jgi:peptidoglycan/xylan/chitin deacetylase (PgdA/CDA1 family)